MRCGEVEVDITMSTWVVSAKAASMSFFRSISSQRWIPMPKRCSASATSSSLLIEEVHEDEARDAVDRSPHLELRVVDISVAGGALAGTADRWDKRWVGKGCVSMCI